MVSHDLFVSRTWCLQIPSKSNLDVLTSGDDLEEQNQYLQSGHQKRTGTLFLTTWCSLANFNNRGGRNFFRMPSKMSSLASAILISTFEHNSSSRCSVVGADILAAMVNRVVESRSLRFSKEKGLDDLCSVQIGRRKIHHRWITNGRCRLQV